MRTRKRTVKRLDAQLPRVFGEALLIHERDCTEATNVSVVESSAVIEVEPHRRIIELRASEIAVVDEQGPGESGLYDKAIAGVEIDHHQLGATPAAENGGVANPSTERARADLTQNVGLAHRHLFYFAPADRAVQIARDRLRFR